MTTHKTNNKLGSAAAKDLFDNAENIDHFANDRNNEYWDDRLDQKRRTIHGMESQFDNSLNQFIIDSEAAILASGYELLDSFQQGIKLPNNEITLRNQALKDERDGEYYRWDGVLPKPVFPGSTPESTGGKGKGAWIGVGGEALRSELTSGSGFSLIGQYISIDAIRRKEPAREGQRILVSSHTAGYECGGGEFYASFKNLGDDNNGTIIKTQGGKYWVRKNIDTVYAVDFGFIVNDESKAASNTQSLLNAAKFAFENGGEVKLPMGVKYINSVKCRYPITFSANKTYFGASLRPRIQQSDVIHLGEGFAFDFIPSKRPTNDDEIVIDGCGLVGLSIKGTAEGLGGWRVGNRDILNNEAYARRNFTATDVQVTGYYSGWGYQMYWTFTNRLSNIVVWNCAATYLMQYSHSTTHSSCVYENSMYGCVSLDCVTNTHAGGAIEGIRAMPSMTKPPDYQEGGNIPEWLNGDYSGIGIRVRGGHTLIGGGCYLEGNKINGHLENGATLTIKDSYIRDTATTEYSIICTSGRIYVKDNILSGNAKYGWIVKNTILLRAHYAEITGNRFIGGAITPKSIPDIALIGIFDTYSESEAATNPHMYTRNYLGIRERHIPNWPENTDIAPITMEAEQVRLRSSSLTGASTDRTIDLYTQAKSGCVVIAQSAGILTLSTSATYLGRGLELTVMINNTGTGPVTVRSGAGFATFSVSAPALKMTVLKFITYNDVYYPM